MMKKAINAWSVPGSVSFEEMFKSISAAGFEGIELNVDGAGASSHSLTLESGRSDYDRINALSCQYNLPVCSISTSLYGGTLGSNNELERERGKNVLRKQLECASALGADGILVVPGGIGDDTSIWNAHENSKQSLMEMVPEIEQAKIKVGLENVWNGFFASPMDMVRLIDELNCTYVGAYFDVGNVAINSYPEYWIEILAHRIFKIHVKDFLHSGWNQGSFVNLLQGDIRWDRVVKVLAAAGYDGFLTAELAEMPKTPGYLYSTTAQALDVIINQLGGK
jgi:L-ribulose-5-phosphate 3-epimerase